MAASWWVGRQRRIQEKKSVVPIDILFSFFLHFIRYSHYYNEGYYTNIKIFNVKFNHEWNDFSFSFVFFILQVVLVYYNISIKSLDHDCNKIVLFL